MTYIVGIDATKTSTTPEFTPGTLGTNAPTGSAPANVFKYVQFNNGAGNVAAVSGNVAYYHEDSGYSTNVATSDLSDSSNIGAGVFQSVPADLSFCWLKIRGTQVLTTTLTAGADGNALTPVGSTDGTLDVSALVTDAICAFAEDASADLIVCAFPE